MKKYILKMQTLHNFKTVMEEIRRIIKLLPSPNSISSLPKTKEGRDPGRLQGAKLTPMVPEIMNISQTAFSNQYHICYHNIGRFMYQSNRNIYILPGIPQASSCLKIK